MKMGGHRKIDLQDEKIRKALFKARIAYDKSGKREKGSAMEKEFKKYAGFLLCRDTLRKYIREVEENEAGAN